MATDKSTRKKKVKKTYTRKYQTPTKGRTKRGIKVDKKRSAKPPGKRVPKGGGEPYYEYRTNRTDLVGDLPRGRPRKSKRKKR